MTLRRRFDVIMTLLLRRVSAGLVFDAMNLLVVNVYSDINVSDNQ